MSRNRDNLPWFPMFASNTISDKRYRLMTPIERALWISILMECWSNGSVPADPHALAKWLGWSAEDAKAGLTEHVLSFFSEVNGELVSPQLEDHWQKHLIRIAKQSEGGKKGVKIKKEKALNVQGQPSGNPQGQPSGEPQGPLNYIKSNSLKSNSIPSPRKEKVNDPFVDAMEAFEAANNEVEVEV